ncbi:SDR family NAD(P)-dependent oxidoreductase [Actinomadura oligospora]|uniref:SDR family NAD(P)-dependent oxidoreductase n=1 Tax=Actinomadura oligospora TaxID=111804 RepID=UPI00047B61BA|nr:SDR family oxidoreductase [Actinomadura oligospora]
MESTNRTVVITGAGSGIGRATAHAFADRGANVVAVGRTLETLRETAAGRARIVPLVADIAAEGGPAAVVAGTMERFGRLDVLVNNAGIVRPSPLGQIEATEFDRFMAVNLRAPLLLTQAALPHLEASSGTVVNVSAAVGQRGWPYMSLYGSTKTGLDFLTRTWAVELAPRGIRVAAVAPGPVDTPILENNDFDPDSVAAMHKLREQLPLARAGTAEEIAFWIVTLADPLAAFTTGIVIPLDGGYSAA